MRIENVDLAMVAPRIGGDYLAHDVRRGCALLEQPQTIRAVKRIDQGLGRYCANARFDMGNERAGSEEKSRNGNSELPGIPIASDDRPSHVRKVMRSKLCDPSHNTRYESE